MGALFKGRGRKRMADPWLRKDANSKDRGGPCSLSKEKAHVPEKKRGGNKKKGRDPRGSYLLEGTKGGTASRPSPP